MLKPALFTISALCFFALYPAFAARAKPAVKEKMEKSESERIDASLAELNALINDSSLNPKKSGKQAMLEDFEENLELSQNQATLTTDDFAKKEGGLQELSPTTLSAPESELE